jgi:CDP-diacylglycerol--serine O-phosphatidyltransferase
MFSKLKDFITVGNILCGFASIAFIIKGNLYLASILIIAAVLFDLADGYIARTFSTANKFGAEFDNLADHISYSIAPAILLYYAISSISDLLAFFMGALIIISGTIRFARFNIKRLEVPGYFVGLPRPASAVLIVAYLNSHLFINIQSLLFTITFVVLLSLMNVMYVAYVGHHTRKTNKLIRILILVFFIICIASFYLGVIWDVLFLAGIIYLISPWLFVSKKKRKDIKKIFKEYVA